MAYLHNTAGEKVNLGGFVTGDFYHIDDVSVNVNEALSPQTGLCLVGMAIREGNPSPAEAIVDIYHGTTVAGGSKMFVTRMGARESKYINLSSIGIQCAGGISIGAVSGQFDITLYYKVV
jgi:hypothetical protein